MLTISKLFIYPIKSLGGIAVSSALVSDRGFQHDRRWLLVDENHRFLTQRQIPAMALLQVELSEGNLTVRHKQKGSTFSIPFFPESPDLISVQIWNDLCAAQPVSEQCDEWFSQMLSQPCRLVYMPEGSRRPVEKDYAKNNEINSFSDAYPFMLIGQASLDDLNQRLDQPLPVNRFRPNIVFTGGRPYEEDDLGHFKINEIEFFGVRPCVRCVIITTDQETAERSAEPLRTLTGYRGKDHKVLFGQNLLHRGSGRVSVGDPIMIQ